MVTLMKFTSYDAPLLVSKKTMFLRFYSFQRHKRHFHGVSASIVTLI